MSHLAAMTGGRFLRQVTFGVAGAGALTSTGTLLLPYPSGIVGMSFLLAQVCSAGGEHTTPSGWQRVPQLLGEALSTHEGYWKVADGTESGNLSMTISGSGDAFGRMYRFSHGTGVESSNDSATVAGDTTIEAEDITTLGPKRMAVQLMMGGANTTIGAISGESGADYAEAAAEYASATIPPGPFFLSCQVAEVPVAAAITGGSATLGADTDLQRVLAFAIIP